MDSIWEQGTATAEHVRQALAAKHPMKESTVRTLLRRLEQKGYLQHEVDGRTFVYRGIDSRQNIAARAVRNIIDRFCGGSVEELLVGMVNQEVIDERELQEMARRVARRKSER